MRGIRVLPVVMAAALFCIFCMTTAYAGDAVFVAPAYLNGLPAYTLTGSAGLANVACDAARAAADCDLAVLSGGMFTDSLPEGPVTYGELLKAVQDGVLIRTEITAAELEQLLNTHLVYEKDAFPQASGFSALARRSLKDDGTFCGIVESLKIGEKEMNADEIAEDSKLYTLVTTEYLYSEVYGLPRHADSLPITVLDALMAYMNSAADTDIMYAAQEERITIVSDTISTNLAVTKLLLNTPAPVTCALSSPTLIPDAVMYALGSQQRSVICQFPLLDIPYSLAVRGGTQEMPATVNTDADVTMILPAGRKTANTFSSNTVFVDLRQNDTLPPGTTITVDLSRIYRPGMLLFLYSYDDNGDIIPMNPASQIAEDGTVTFPVENGMTYVINDLQLNRAYLHIPTPEHPWSAGILIVFALFAGWCTVLWLGRRRKRRH